MYVCICIYVTRCRLGDSRGRMYVIYVYDIYV
jgi:hypothetical protein